jgi:hypothetical protein
MNRRITDIPDEGEFVGAVTTFCSRLVSSRAFSIPVPIVGQVTFVWEGATIQPLTTIGEVTARIFGFNDSARLHEREEMIGFGKSIAVTVTVLLHSSESALANLVSVISSSVGYSSGAKARAAESFSFAS